MYYDENLRKSWNENVSVVHSGNQKHSMILDQWFLTGGTRTPWGYQTPEQGVRSTNIFRHTRPENFKDVLSIVVSAVNLSEAMP